MLFVSLIMIGCPVATVPEMPEEDGGTEVDMAPTTNQNSQDQGTDVGV